MAASRATTHRSASGSTRATKTAAKSGGSKKSAKKNGHCWPGFEPVAGKKAGTKGSCERIPGKHSASTRKATQKFAAASKLDKQGKPNPKP